MSNVDDYNALQSEKIRLDSRVIPFTPIIDRDRYE